MAFCDFTAFSPFGTSKPLFFQMCLIWSSVPYPSPDMINFDTVDFGECRSEEVIYRVSQLKCNTFQWFIVLRLEGKYLCIYDMVR